QTDGSLLPYPSYPDNKDQNYNAFTVNMYIRWIFAPGSELVFMWRNDASSWSENVMTNYLDNLKQCLDEQANSLSLKVLYYLDCNKLKLKKL
ncbi:MAG: DUF5916 domain-containing protein, partial [Bacteroidota bacterium]|nr:DUF5916 domain-containing protein [Bacteroidota bacterium]